MLAWLTRRKKLLPEPLPGDQRRAVRHSCELDDHRHLAVRVGVAAWPALVRDISATGIGLILGQRYQEGTALPLQIVDMRSSEYFPLRALVVYTQRREDGHWFTGCVFEGPLQTKVLEQLL